MKNPCIPVLVLVCLLLAAGAPASAESEQVLWGPTKYDVKERYGRDNRYTASFPVAAGPAVIKLQNGAKPVERVDLLSFSVNGQEVLSLRHSDYNFLAFFLPLQKENTFVLDIRDYTPQPLKRPPATPKNAEVSVVTVTANLPPVVLGLNGWENLNAYAAALLKIKAPESFAFALSSADLKNEVSGRTEATRKLAARKDPEAKDYLLHILLDLSGNADMRGEAASGIGLLRDTSTIPVLIQSVLDPEEPIRIGAARGLANFPEDETSGPLAKTLERMDVFMSSAVVRSIVAAGWKPVGTLLGFTESKDPAVANMGIELLTGVNEPRVTERLLTYLAAPGPRDVRLVIRVLGETKDKNALAALTAFAADPVKRRGNEVELADAFAKSGDPAKAALIVDMIKNTQHGPTRRRLIESYRTLTGKDYQ